MYFTTHYLSPLGGITLASDGEYLTGLWFDGQKYFAQSLPEAHEERPLPVFRPTAAWLDDYFSGRMPDAMPPIRLSGSPFQLMVWNLLRQIPYGTTRTYKELAAAVARQKGILHMSAQAIGGAVGHNPVSILIPCHRVVGSHGSLTGYAGGLDKKIALLKLEKADVAGLFIPASPTLIKK